MSAETTPIAREPIFDPEHPGASLHRFNKLVLPLRRPLDGLINGDISSPRRGEGFEKDGLREYQDGDNERHVDWYATARLGQQTPLIRERYRDITPNLYVVTDAPQERNAITQGEFFSEQELAMSVGGVMLLMAQKQGIPTSLFAINDSETRGSKRPSSGRSHMLQSGRQLAGLAGKEANASDKQQHLSELLSRVARTATKSVVVVVSDFRDADPDAKENGWLAPLQHLRGNENNIVAVELTNPEDYEMPEEVERLNLGEGKVAWLGRGRSAQKTRDIYRELALEQQAGIDNALTQVRATHIQLSTTDPLWFSSLKGQLRNASRQVSKRK